MMNELPCKECLTMPLCKDRLKKSGVFSSTGHYVNTYGIAGMANRENCESLWSHLREAENIGGQPSYDTAVRNARRFFGLEADNVVTALPEGLKKKLKDRK